MKAILWGAAKATLWGNILAMSACGAASQINLRNYKQPNNIPNIQNPQKTVGRKN